MPSELQGSPITGEIGDILEKYFISDFRSKGYRKFRNVTLPAAHSRFAEAVENFQVRDDDIWVMSYPKTGTCSKDY